MFFCRTKTKDILNNVFNCICSYSESGSKQHWTPLTSIVIYGKKNFTNSHCVIRHNVTIERIDNKSIYCFISMLYCKIELSSWSKVIHCTSFLCHQVQIVFCYCQLVFVKGILYCCVRLILCEHSVSTGNRWQHILCCLSIFSINLTVSKSPSYNILTWDPNNFVILTFTNYTEASKSRENVGPTFGA